MFERDISLSDAGGEDEAILLVNFLEASNDFGKQYTCLIRLIKWDS